MATPERVLSFGVYSSRPEYPRHRSLLEGLRSQGVEVRELRYPLADSFQERVRGVGSPVGGLAFGIRLLASYLSLLMRSRPREPVDAILVGYPGIFHAPLARLVRRRYANNPQLVLDSFAPLYETVVGDRRLFDENKISARWLHRAEAAAYQKSDLCLIDTREHAGYLQREFDLPAARCQAVPVGPSFPVFPSPAEVRPEAMPFRVLFIGTYVPLQGVETIVQAAERLQSSGVQFHLYGRGQERNRVEALARSLGLGNVQFKDWLGADELAETLRSFDLALGIFGSGPKAQRVIPHKVVDACAAGVPILTADSPAIREVFDDQETAFLVPPSDPEALANAVLRLQASLELRVKLASGAHDLAQTIFSPEQIGSALIQAMCRSAPC